MYRRETDKAESESKRNSVIIGEYKQICSQLSERLEKQQTAAKQAMLDLRVGIPLCYRVPKCDIIAFRRHGNWF